MGSEAVSPAQHMKDRLGHSDVGQIRMADGPGFARKSSRETSVSDLVESNEFLFQSMWYFALESNLSTAVYERSRLSSISAFHRT